MSIISAWIVRSYFLVFCIILPVGTSLVALQYTLRRRKVLSTVGDHIADLRTSWRPRKGDIGWPILTISVSAGALLVQHWVSLPLLLFGLALLSHAVEERVYSKCLGVYRNAIVSLGRPMYWTEVAYWQRSGSNFYLLTTQGFRMDFMVADNEELLEAELRGRDIQQRELVDPKYLPHENGLNIV